MKNGRKLARLTVLALAIGASLVLACGQEPSVCPENMGIDILNFTADAYNDVVRNSGGGSGLHLAWTCLNGGSADITGSANTSTVSYDLTFTFHMCSDYTSGTLTLDGTLHDQATNGSSSATKVENAHSDALTINGYSIGCKADPIDATCVVDINPISTTVCGLSSL